jgi:hypothetical protein
MTNILNAQEALQHYKKAKQFYAAMLVMALFMLIKISVHWIRCQRQFFLPNYEFCIQVEMLN